MNKQKVITCPKCKKQYPIDIASAIDEEGEVFQCPNCGWKSRYTERVTG